MNKNRKSILLFLASLIVVVFALYIYNKIGNPGNSASARNFAIAPEENIVLLEFSKNNENIKLEINKSGLWVINDDFAANNLAINDLIRTLKNLYIKHPISVDEKDEVSKNLEESGVKICVYARRYVISIGDFKVFPYKTKLKCIYVGSDYNESPGTIMKIEGAAMPYVVHIPGQEEGISRHFSANYYEWRDPVVANIKQTEINSLKVVVFNNDKESFILYNKNDNFQITDLDNNSISDNYIDTLKIQRLISAFSDLYFEKLLYGDELINVKEELSNIAPTYSISIEDKNFKIIKLDIYHKKLAEIEKEELGVTTDIDPNLFYLKVNENEYSLARYFVFSRILRPLSFYIKKSD